MSRVFGANATDAITIAPSSSINSLSAFTYAAWVNPASLSSGNSYVIAGRLTAPFTRTICFFFDNFGLANGSNSLCCFMSSPLSGARSVGANNTMNANSWQRVVATYDSAGDQLIHLYINGVEISYGSQVSGSVVLATNSLQLGNSGGFSSLVFHGDIAEFQLWNVALSSAQVASDYSGSSVLPGNLAAYLHLCGLQSPEPDATGNGNNGTLTGTTTGPDSPGYSCSTSLSHFADSLVQISNMSVHNLDTLVSTQSTSSSISQLDSLIDTGPLPGMIVRPAPFLLSVSRSLPMLPIVTRSDRLQPLLVRTLAEG